MNLRSLAATVLTCVLVGCAAPPPAPKSAPASLEQIVSEHNASAGRVDKLWANATITVWVPSRPFPWTFTSGTLLLGKGNNPQGPHDFVLMAREGGQPIFQLGSNVEQNVYYFWAHYGDQGQLWKGRLNLAGAPGVDIPIDPTQLPAVLDVLELPADQTKLPAVAMTLRDARPVMDGAFIKSYDPYSYELSYVDRQSVSGRIIFKRQILVRRSDSEPRLPYKINFMSADGRVVMIASLDKYKPIDGTAGAGRPAAMMPTDIDIVWPDKNSRLHLVLSDMTTTKGEPAEASRLIPQANLPQTDVDEFVVGASRPADSKGSK